MHAPWSIRATCLLAIVASSLAGPVATNGASCLNARADEDAAASKLDELLSQAADKAQTALKEYKRSECNLQNLRIRREWTNIPEAQKLSYLNAVKCLQGAPAKTPSELAPGAKTRFDDFVATHINQTLTIHYTGNFLSWHRYFTWVYEEALRIECGYEGTQPYWDWSKSARNGLHNHPLWDGSATSVSGDGAFVEGKSDVVFIVDGVEQIRLPPGTGGGCVTSGPFKDLSVNLGPVALSTTDNEQTISNPAGQFAYNPRCLKRDLTDWINRRYANASAILDLVLNSPDIDTFQLVMQGRPYTPNIGVHGGGHYSMGGDPGRDVFVSPGDPAFFFHHAMIDRTWWMWQLLDAPKRTDAIAGTRTWANSPPSLDTTLDDVVTLDYVTEREPKIRELMSTLEGPFCYIYL